MRIQRDAAYAAVFVFVTAAGAARAGSISGISGISVINDSSPNPATENRFFDTESSVSPISLAGSTVSFTHRMAAYNSHTGLGGVAQTNKRNVVFQLDFTVVDSASVGFTLDLEAIIRNITTLNLVTNPGGFAMATGLHLGASFNDSTMEPGVYENLPLPILGQSTPGVGLVSELGSYAVYQESIESATLGDYVGTTAFSFRFTSVTTSTTNVLFPNNATGNGAVNLGLGEIPEEFAGILPSDLGHFLTVSATFAPTPGAAALFGIGGLALVRRRR